jgi:hypothetical protein
MIEEKNKTKRSRLPVQALSSTADSKLASCIYRTNAQQWKFWFKWVRHF